MIESIEKLRGYAPHHPELYAVCNAAADEIEAEIAERYIELPVDADGVPIQLGDKVWVKWAEEEREVIAFTSEDLILVPELYVHPSEVTHAKPRTVEDVLRDCCNEWNEHCGEDWETSVYVKYADELRGLLGGNDG